MKSQLGNIALLAFFALISFAAIIHNGKTSVVHKAKWKSSVGPACVRDGSVGKNVNKNLDRISKLDLVLPGVILGL